MLYKYIEVKKNIYKWREENKEEYNEYLKTYMRSVREYKKDYDFERIQKVFRKILL